MNIQEMTKLRLTKPEKCFHGTLYGHEAWCGGYMLTYIGSPVMRGVATNTHQDHDMIFDPYVPFDADMELTVWGCENWYKRQYYAVLADRARNAYLANARHIAHFLRCYKEPHFYTGSDPYSPIVVKVAGDAVGMVMPLDSTGYPMPVNVADYIRIDFPDLTYSPAMFDRRYPPLERIAATKRTV